MNSNPNYIKGGNATKLKWDKIKEEYIKTNPSFCTECNDILPYRKRSNKFCGSSCAASFNNRNRDYIPTEDHRTKVSDIMKRKGIKPPAPNRVENEKKYLEDPNHCIICNVELSYNNRSRKTCSDNCLAECRSKHGRKVAQLQSNVRRSKNEELFAKKCQNYFDDVLTNESIFNGWDADVIIEDINVAVLWNGIWHYEKITESHSVKQVQNRDAIKIKEIKTTGYTPYIIKDMGSFNEEKVESEFKKFIKWACTPSVS